MRGTLPALIVHSARLDARRGGLLVLALLGPMAVLAAELFDVWGSGLDRGRTWGLGLGVLEVWVCLAVLLGGGALGTALSGSRWGDALRSTAAGWRGLVVHELLWGSLRAMVCASPALACVLVLYIRTPDASPGVAPWAGLLSLALHTLQLSALALALRRWLPPAAAALGLLAAEVLCHGLTHPGLQSLLAYGVSADGIHGAAALASLVGAAGWTLLTAGLPPSAGRA